MSKERYLNTKFWDDNYIVNLDPTEKLLFIYLLTNPLTNIIGIYEIAIRRIAFDTGIDQDMVLKILDRFERDNKIKYSQGYIVIRNFIKHQKNNPSINKGIETSLQEVPNELLEWITLQPERFNISKGNRQAVTGSTQTATNINLNLNRNINIKKERKEKEKKEKFPPSNSKTRKKIKSKTIDEIILYLNQKAEKQYKLTTPKTRNLIRVRLKQGFTADDFKSVIDKKTKQWKGVIAKDGRSMETFLRPETLFDTKFESYLNEPENNNQEWMRYVK